jgi:MprA protease rhombosortase-interaction domain-containing protein
MMTWSKWLVGGAWTVGFSAAALAGGSARAALLTGAVDAAPASPFDLTTNGPVDWAIWDDRASTDGTNGAPSNRKSGGSAISAVTAALGTPRGITGTIGGFGFTYTNGTSPASQTNANIGAITDTSINVANSGIKFNVTGQAGVTEVVKVVVAGFNSVGKFTATLNGAPTYTDSSVSYVNSTRSETIYTLTFQPDSAADLLQVSYTIGTLNAGGNSNVDLQAVTVIAPEPGTAGVLAVAGVAGFARRRRRRLQ